MDSGASGDLSPGPRPGSGCLARIRGRSGNVFPGHRLASGRFGGASGVFGEQHRPIPGSDRVRVLRVGSGGLRVVSFLATVRLRVYRERFGWV